MTVTYEVVTAREGERYHRLHDAMDRAEEQQFLGFDAAVARYWDLLADAFPAYQFCLVERESGETAAVGNCLPLAFHGDWSGLPDEGLDWALVSGFADRSAHRKPNLASALYIEVAGNRRGLGLSSKMLGIMRGIVREQGFRRLIAPVRPSRKDRYPLIDIEEYMSWQTPEGLPFDPWLRVHVRAGGRMLHPCPAAMRVEGSRDDWSYWTDMPFPGDGEYVIPFGLVPLPMAGDRGVYVEPGVWVLHELE